MLWILLGLLSCLMGICLIWFYISIIKNGETVKHHTLNFFFLAPFFEQRQLARLRKKHVGRQVHIYYNPANKLQALVREYMWKDFLMALFLIFLGCTLILSRIMNWY